MTVTKVVEGCVYIRRRYYGILPRVGGGGGNFLLVVHGKEEKKRKEKVSRSCGGVLKEDRRVLRMHAFVFLLKLHNKSLY